MSLFPNYWIVSVPAEPDRAQALSAFSSTTAGLATNCRLDIPELRVGTLDSLMQISDELGKQDLFAETTISKISNNLAALLDRDPAALEKSLTANGMPIAEYLKRFQWNEAKFPVRNSVRDLVDSILKQFGEIDADMKTKMTAYSNSKTNLANLDRKQTGNLLVRSLNDVVDKKNFILDSEFMTTLLVVVSKHHYKDWVATYEKLSDMVVPRSTEKISEDKDYGLFSVVVFKKFVDDFKVAAREKKFIVRDFEYSEDDIESERQERTQLGADLKKQLTNLRKWMTTNFSEAFEAWMHLKALRVFVESVLRYGLPPNFIAIIFPLVPKHEKKLRSTLKTTYGHLGSTDETEDTTHLLHQGEYYPYVFFNLNLEGIK